MENNVLSRYQNKGYFGDQDVDGRITLKCVLQN